MYLNGMLFILWVVLAAVFGAWFILLPAMLISGTATIVFALYP